MHELNPLPSPSLRLIPLMGPYKSMRQALRNNASDSINGESLNIIPN